MHANTRKHVSEHSCSSVRVFLSVLAHLAQFFFLILNGINKCLDISMQIQKNMSVSIADRRQMSRMRAAYNSIYRKIFNYSYRESVTNLQHTLGRPTWEELIAKRKNNFVKHASRLPVNSLVRVTCT